MAITFTESEIEVLSKCPEALRIIATWHDVQQGHADDWEMGTCGDGNRHDELMAEAERLESEY